MTHRLHWRRLWEPVQPGVVPACCPSTSPFMPSCRPPWCSSSDSTSWVGCCLPKGELPPRRAMPLSTSAHPHSFLSTFSLRCPVFSLSLDWLQAAGVPATPFEQRRTPAAGPVTATKPPAATPGGFPANTPLAAEVLASLNAVASHSIHGSAAAAADPATAAASGAPVASAVFDPADGAAAATLSGLLSGLEPGHSGMAAQQAQQQQPDQRQEHSHQQPALASLLQEAALQPPPPMRAAAMAAAAAAAAAPALPVPRRQSAASAALLPLTGMQQRERRPCNCKRSMCLKMYCECFAAGEVPPYWCAAPRSSRLPPCKGPRS